MLERKHCCYGLCKTDSEVSNRENKCHKLHKDLTKPQWQADRSSSSSSSSSSQNLQALQGRELAEDGATSQSECFKVKRITRTLICCLSWSSREDLPADLCQKFPISTTRAVCSNEYYRTGGHHCLRDDSKFGAKFGVLCNLEDHDFNRTIYPTT